MSWRAPLQSSLRPANLDLLPWQVRLHLERLVMPDRNIHLLPKPRTFEDLIHKVLDDDNKEVLEVMQNLIPICEKAGDPSFREMIVQSPHIRWLSELLQSGHTDLYSMRSESAFLLMKLAYSGGEPCIKKFLEYDVIPELVKMMQCHIAELQDSAYTALHQMLFGNGGVLVLNKIIQMGLTDKIAHAIR
ncbi:hypothetical protein CRYUN_Cryun34aG0087000 [Craigia yunnanensis]